ncbi:hypothetical protein AUJ17_03895 [Candidatus Micrarchaeota archaeon CG1_02_47_40]|nr:MAG: hypothetical protein AUJ17_03895 [Candidatus Micrarchaeota archaeon CG1_02_47_40]
MFPFGVFISLPIWEKKEKKEGEGKLEASPHIDECRESIYRKIIERYERLIEENEAKSVLELKGLVQPNHAKIEGIANAIKEKRHEYSSETDFSDAASEAVEFISRIRGVQLPVSFWLSFEEIGELGVADSMDKCIMLCSLLRALGSPDAVVFLTKAREVFVGWEFGEKYFLFDAEKNETKKGRKEEMVAQMKGSLIYTFNDKEYVDYSEGD